MLPTFDLRKLYDISLKDDLSISFTYLPRLKLITVNPHCLFGWRDLMKIVIVRIGLCTVKQLNESPTKLSFLFWFTSIYS